jgi:hypothetical protein
MYIEDENFLKDNHKEFINNVILTDKFPFYWNSSAVKDDDLGFLVHNILIRPESRIKGDNGINSSAYDIFCEMLNCFTKKHNINFNEVLRISVNLTMNVGLEKSKIHKDHNFPHKQLLIYLNDFEGGSTVILNDDKTVFKITNPKKFLGVCFGQRDHYANLPKKGRRLVAVFTFR